jgi:amino acid permease
MGNDIREFVGKCAGAVIAPTIVFWLYYAGGWFLAKFAGNLISNCINVIFSTNKFEPNLIAPTLAIFAVIVSMIKKEKIDEKEND